MEKPQRRSQLIVLGIASMILLLAAGIWGGSRLLGLTHQMRGSKILQTALENSDEESLTFACGAEPASSTRTRQLIREAIGSLENALHYNPNLPKAYLELGRAYCLLGETVEGISYFVPYTRLRPNNPLAHIEIALAYETLAGMHPAGAIDIRSLNLENIQECQPCIAFRNASMNAWKTAGYPVEKMLQLGDEAFTKKLYDEALEWYHRVIWHQPEAEEAWLAAGRIYSARGDRESAEYAYRLALKSDPELRDGWYELGLIYMAERKWALALETFQQGLQAAEGQNNLSNIYFEIGQIYQLHLPEREPEKAWEAYEQALAINQFISPETQIATVHLYRGHLHSQAGRYEDAIQEYQRALQRTPRNYLAILGLARALWNTDQTDQAQAQLRQAISYEPHRTGAYRLLGDILADIGDTEEAEQMYRKVLELSPNDSRSREALDALLKK